VTHSVELLDVHTVLTPVDDHTHRRYPFEVPSDCTALRIGVRYAPKALAASEGRQAAEAALVEQAARLGAQLGDARLASSWAEDHAAQAHSARVSNLVTITLDDAVGAYRGAGHRHAEDQQLVVRPDAASPGLVPGPLPAGRWVLTLSAHTLVTAQCAVEIQIGAETASSWS
jgi:hypothetical protein